MSEDTADAEVWYWVVRKYSYLTANDSGIISWTAPEEDSLEAYDSYQAAWRKVSRLRRFRARYERDSTEPVTESFEFFVRRIDDSYVAPEETDPLKRVAADAYLVCVQVWKQYLAARDASGADLFSLRARHVDAWNSYADASNAVQAARPMPLWEIKSMMKHLWKLLSLRWLRPSPSHLRRESANPLTPVPMAVVVGSTQSIDPDTVEEWRWLNGEWVGGYTGSIWDQFERPPDLPHLEVTQLIGSQGEPLVLAAFGSKSCRTHLIYEGRIPRWLNHINSGALRVTSKQSGGQPQGTYPVIETRAPRHTTP